LRKAKSTLYLMIIPSAILFLIFCYIPMSSLVLAFRKYDIVGGLYGTTWVGFKYFLQFFNDPYFFRIVRNTIVLNLYMLLIAFPAPIVFALLLNEIRKARFRKMVQSISYVPHFLSTVIVVGLMMELLSSRGIVNQALMSLGIEKQLFFQESGWFRTLYVGSSVWEGMGWSSIIYMAALAGINPELYEAARIDGAGRFQMIRYITVPCLMPTIAILFILAVGRVMSVGFEKVYLMYSPATYETADVISTYIYRRGILGMDYSYAVAVGLFNSVINFILLMAANYTARKAGYGLW